MTAELLCLILLGATVALVIFAEIRKPARAARVAGVVALVTILAADYYLFAAMNRRDGWLATEIARLFPERDDQKRLRDQQGRNGTGGAATAAGDGQSSIGDDGRPGRSSPSPSAQAAYEALDAVSDWFGRHRARTVAAPPPEEAFRDCPQCPEMVRVPAADVLIGTDASDRERQASDAEQRRMRVWPGLAIARSEITIEQLAHAGLAAAATCSLPSSQPGDASAACVTPDLISDYLAWLNARTGKRYRLPTAAEWEFSARLAESTTPAPRGLGGGLAELVRDCWPARLPPVLADGPPAAAAAFARCPYRIVKDAADGEDASWRRFAARRAVRSDFASPRIGFRVLRDLDVRVSARP